MSGSDRKILTDVVAAFSTVIAETTRAIARNSGGQVSRHSIALDLQKYADKLSDDLDVGKRILSNIAAQLDDKPFTPLVFSAQDK